MKKICMIIGNPKINQIITNGECENIAQAQK